jgi:O-antigen/teichoic acid export membrane protein
MLRKVLHTFFSRGINAVLNLLLVLITARFLGAEVRGEISLLVASMNLSLHAVGLAGGAALLYLVPRFAPGHLYRISMGWMFLVSVFTLPVLQLAGQWQGLSAGLWLLLLLLFNAANVNRYMLLAFRQIELDNRIGIGFGTLQLALLSAFLLWGSERNLLLFVYVLLAANAALLLLTTVLVAKHWPEESAKQEQGVFKSIFGHGFWVQMANIAQLFSYRLSYYLLEGQLGTEAVGIYGVAVSLAEALWIVSRSISLVQVSEIANSHDKLEQQQLTATWSRVTIWLTAICLIPLLSIPDAWFGVIFGTDFTGIRTLLFWLAPGILALATSNILTHYFSGRGKYQLNALVSAFTLVVVAILLPSMIVRWGVVGAAAGQSIAYLMALLFAILLFSKGKLNIIGSVLPQLADLKLLLKKWQAFREKA